MFMFAFIGMTSVETKGPRGPWLNNPCINASSAMSSLPWCDYTLSVDVRAADAVSRLSLSEKINALGTNTGPLDSLELNAYNWWSEATHGISHVRDGPSSTTPKETNFALPITTAGSFNRSLWTATGRQIGVEARAFMNAGNAYSTYWAPVINLVRDPRWGRNIETPGEDPYLTGQYAINFVQGFQNNPIDPTHVQASACCKHYVANSMESTDDGEGNVHNRQEFNAIVKQQDLVDSYMAPFQDCVEQGKVTSLMCSYNAVNGIPSCANDWLLTTVARGEWEFDGYITSDCDADANVYTTHHYTATPGEAVRDVLRAGTDVDCGGFVTHNAQGALDNKTITVDDIDVRLRYLFRMRLRLGHFDPPGPLQEIPKSAVCTDFAVNLARQGTIQGSVLLKNAEHALPLLKSSTVALIGPNSNLSHSIATYYGGGSPCHGFTSMVDAVSSHAKSMSQSVGCASVTASPDPKLLAAAVDAARSADEVVMAVGQDGSIEHEGHDRTSISLTQCQEELVAAVAKAAKKPVTVVILTGGAVDVAEMMANTNVGAIIHAGQPSVTAIAIGDLLFGDVSPAGRMIQTIYPKTFVDEVSIFDMNMRPGPSDWPIPNHSPKTMGTNPGRTHRFYTGTPTTVFGFGLSYSTFKYGLASAPKVVDLAPLRAILEAPDAKTRTFFKKEKNIAMYAVNVTNTGKIDADDVVLGFVTPPGGGKNGIPIQTLFGFQRVHVKSGETVTVWLAAEAQTFSHVNEQGKRVVLEGDWGVHFGVRETLPYGGGYLEHSHVAM
jgi:beta-glucosidase-like glycosyl hydrolase